VALLQERFGTQFNNSSVPNKSPDCLPLSLPDASPIDIYSSDTFPFPDPLLGSNARILASGLFNLMLNHLKHNIISLIHFLVFLSLGRQVWTNDHMAKDCSRVTFPVTLDMVPYAFLTKTCSSYQLAAGISHPAVPRTIKVIT
jgi:hypothetical protein